MVTKDADGTWNEDLCTSGYVGYGGVGETTEWNRKTPRGQFSFTYAFGILPNPGTELSYTQVDDTYYWVDDVNSRYYNQFVTTKTTPKAWNSAEHIMRSIRPIITFCPSITIQTALRVSVLPSSCTAAQTGRPADAFLSRKTR